MNDKKIATFIALAGFFIGLAIGVNVGNIFEMPIIVNVALLVVGCFFGGLAANFHQKGKNS